MCSLRVVRWATMGSIVTSINHDLTTIKATQHFALWDLPRVTAAYQRAKLVLEAAHRETAIAAREAAARAAEAEARAARAAEEAARAAAEEEEAARQGSPSPGRASPANSPPPLSRGGGRRNVVVVKRPVRTSAALFSTTIHKSAFGTDGLIRDDDAGGGGAGATPGNTGLAQPRAVRPRSDTLVDTVFLHDMRMTRHQFWDVFTDYSVTTQGGSFLNLPMEVFILFSQAEPRPHSSDFSARSVDSNSAYTYTDSDSEPGAEDGSGAGTYARHRVRASTTPPPRCDAREVFLLLALLCNGTHEAQIRFAFNLMDADESGAIDQVSLHLANRACGWGLYPSGTLLLTWLCAAHDDVAGRSALAGDHVMRGGIPCQRPQAAGHA